MRAGWQLQSLRIIFQRFYLHMSRQITGVDITFIVDALTACSQQVSMKKPKYFADGPSSRTDEAQPPTLNGQAYALL
ncbi:MAG: hypothetical protein ACSHXK_04695 [Oceanococcus sp.]